MNQPAVSRIVLVILVLGLAAGLAAQIRSQVTIFRTEATATGVIIVSAKQGDTSIELQCNQSMPTCTLLPVGTYFMVELPRNRGKYDCTNVLLYRSPADADADARAGEYCLEGK